jgi:hypothetical protein
MLLVTIDHMVIFEWARDRGARPSTCEGDERPWPLVFSFGAVGAGLKEISWDRFFAEFDQADLAFVCTEVDGKLDDSYQFIKRVTVPELILSGQSTITVPAM